MPKKLFFYALGLLLLAVAGMYGFTKWTEAREKVNLWTLVPEDAVVVLESSDHEKFLEQIQKSELWDNIASMRAVEALTENIALLDSVSGGRKEGASRFLKRKTILTSVHVVSKTNFDFIFYIPVNTVGEHRFVRTLVDNINKSRAFEDSTYEYQQFLVTDIKNLSNNDTFSYFTYHNNLVVSANPELIKEIIRKVNRQQLASPAAEFENINYLGQPEVFAQIFVNYRHVPPFFNIFLRDELMPDITYLASLCRNSMLGLKHQRGKIFLNGFSNPEPLSDSFYNRVKNQEPKPFALRNYLPARTALLLTFGLDRVVGFKHISPADRKNAWSPREIILSDSLTRTFQNELGVAYLAAPKDAGQAQKIVFVQSTNPAKTTGILEALRKEGTAQLNTKLTTEIYAGYTIKNIPLTQFPLLLFGSVARGFEKCYAVQVDNFTLFGPDIITLRQALADIKQGNVWANTDKQKSFLENTQQETNFSVYADTELIWRMLRRQVREKQQSSLLRHETLLKYFNQVALQFSQNRDQYYTSLVINHPVLADTVPKTVETYHTQYQTPFPNQLVSPPYFLNREVGGAARLMVQDSANIVHALRDNGQVAWSDTLNNTLIAPIYPVVFGEDKRVKYLFTTANTIYCLDQNGRNVQNFPFNLPDSVLVQRLTLINSQQPNNQLLLLNDQRGNLFMFDVVGDLKSGWEPKQLGSPLASAPQYYQVNGREVILTFHQNGYVYAFNLNGILYPGFPLAFEGTFNSDVFMKAGNTLRATQFTTVTQEGQLISFNLAGQVQQRKQLPSTNRRANFSLILEPQRNSYIIARQEPGRISLYDQNQKLLLQKNLITSSRKLVQYFDFGPLNRIYTLTETGPRKTYLYNYKAKLIGQEALTNIFPVTIEFNKATNSYSLYMTMGNEVRKISFRDK